MSDERHPATTSDDLVEVVSEWLDMVEREPTGLGGVLRYPPICQSEIDAIRALLNNQTGGGG
jgi:hypothetical protein